MLIGLEGSGVFFIFLFFYFFFLVTRRPPRSTQSRSSAASDVYKRQGHTGNFRATIKGNEIVDECCAKIGKATIDAGGCLIVTADHGNCETMINRATKEIDIAPVSYTHLRAHETPEHLVCRLLLEKKKKHSKHLSDLLAYHQHDISQHSHTRPSPSFIHPLPQIHMDYS